VNILFSLGSFMKITEGAEILVLLFTPRYKLCITFDKKWVGPHFGQYFQKVVKSSWAQLTAEENNFLVSFLFTWSWVVYVLRSTPVLTFNRFISYLKWFAIDWSKDVLGRMIA
jgi:hypothetical protein